MEPQAEKLQASSPDDMMVTIFVSLKYSAVGETVLGIELSFTWWVIFFELFVLLAAFAHLIGEAFAQIASSTVHQISLKC